MIGTLIRAKEYIEHLQMRVIDLERLVALTHGPQSQMMAMGHPLGAWTPLPYASYASPALAALPMPQPTSLPPKAPTGVKRSSTVSTNHEDSAEADDAAANYAKAFKKGRHGSFANLFSIMEEAHTLGQGGASPNNENVPEQGNIVRGRQGRRDSALLLPTADPNLFLYGHRDSMNNLFAAPLPYIMEQQKRPEDSEPANATITCKNCSSGIDNLIMIDCDQCHAWFHIKCIGLDSERIPIRWVCEDCQK